MRYLILLLICYIHLVLSRELDSTPVKITLEDTKVSGWRDWRKNTPKYIGWRQQSRAGSGQIVYSVCETTLARVDRDLWPSRSKSIEQLATPKPLPTMQTPRRIPDQNAERVRRDNRANSRTGVSGFDQAEYWLISPVLNSDQILSIHIDIGYQMQSCQQNANSITQDARSASRCREDFDVMIRHFDQLNNESRLQDFQEIEQVKSDSLHQMNAYGGSDLVKLLKARFRPTNKHFQLALRDTGACVLVDQLQVYHLYCAQTEVNLMQLPQTHAGHNAEIRFVPGSCRPGAKQIPDRYVSFPRNQQNRAVGAFCMANGKWHLDDDRFQCICEPGFELGPEGFTCEACLRGTYKSMAGNTECHVCPLNSMATNLGQRECDCLPGYFRLSRTRSPNYPCFGPPSSPRNLNAVRINGTSVELSWDKPVRSGGLKDVQFHVACQGCTPNMVTYSPSNLLNGTRVFISGLQPLTRYQFDVHAQNEASSLADALWTSVASVIVTTRSAPTVLVSQVQARWIDRQSVELHWKSVHVTPTSINQSSFERDFTEYVSHFKTIVYEVCLILANDSTSASSKPKDSNLSVRATATGLNKTISGQAASGLVDIPMAVYYTSETKILLHNLSTEHSYWVQIRAQTDYAYGPYSSPVYVQLAQQVQQGQWTTPFTTRKNLMQVITSVTTFPAEHSVPVKHPTDQIHRNTEEKIITTGLILSISLALCMGLVLLLVLLMVCFPTTVKKCPLFAWILRKTSSEIEKPPSKRNCFRGRSKLDQTKLWSHLMGNLNHKVITIERQVGQNCFGPSYLGWMTNACFQHTRSLKLRGPISLSMQWANQNELGTDLSQSTVASSAGPSPHKQVHMDARSLPPSPLLHEDRSPVWIQIIRSRKSAFMADTAHRTAVESRTSFVLRPLQNWLRKRQNRNVFVEQDKLIRKAICRNMELSHPAVIQTFGVMFTNRQPMIVSQWMPGGSLARNIDQVLQATGVQSDKKTVLLEYDHVFTLNSYVSMLVDIASGLEYLHERQIYYELLTTKDVFLDRNNRCRLRVPLLTPRPIAVDLCGVVQRDHQISTAVYANHFSSTGCETLIDLSVPGSFSTAVTQAKLRPSTGSVNKNDGATPEGIVSMDRWATVTVPKVKLNTPFFSNLLLNNQYAFLSELSKSGDKDDDSESADPSVRMCMQTDNPLNVFHRLIHRLETRRPEKRTGQVFNEDDVWFNANMNLPAQDVWCFGGIAAELLITHVLQYYPVQWQLSWSSNAPERTPTTLPGRKLFQPARNPNDLLTDRSLKPFSHVVKPIELLEPIKEFSQIQDWQQLIQWLDAHGFQSLGAGHLLSQCRYACAKQRPTSIELYRMCSAMQQFIWSQTTTRSCHTMMSRHC